MLLLLIIFSGAVNAARLWVANSATPGARAGATLAMLFLVGWWIRGYRRRGFPEAGLVLEALALIAVSYGNGGSQGAAGFLIVGVAFRSLWYSGRRGVLAPLTYGAAFCAGSLPAVLASIGPYILVQVFAVVAFGVALWALAEALAGQERATEARLQALADLNRFKDELLDGVAHELRTPLASILAYSELLLTCDDPPVRQEFLGIINDESRRLSRLVNNVLDVAKIQSGTTVWTMARVDVSELLFEAARIHRPLVEQQGLHFELTIEPGLPPIDGDRDRLLEVVANLITNALKFTVEGDIGLSGRQAAGDVLVSVSDTGIGVPEADRERIFERFEQLRSPLQGKPRGTGLGLAICREVVARHHGRIWADERPGGGSVFTFSVPLLQAEPAAPAITLE